MYPLGRKSRVFVPQKKFYSAAFPATAQLSTGRKGRVLGENWGKCLTQRRDGMLYILMSDQDVLWWLLCQKKTQNISVLIREFEGTKTCNATNVPQEGRPLGKCFCFCLWGSWMWVCVEWNLSRSITVSQSTSLVQYGGLMLWCLVQCPFGFFFYYQVTIFCNIFVNDQLVAKFKSSRFEFIYNQVQKN